MPESLGRRLLSTRLTDWLGVATIVLVALILVMAVVYGAVLIGRTGAVSEATDVLGCRDLSAARVTQARTEFDVARANRDTAATHLNLLIAQGLVALVQDDEATLRSTLPLISEANAAVATAERRVVAATAHLNAVNDQHQAAIVRSRENTDEFLADCRAGFPDT